MGEPPAPVFEIRSAPPAKIYVRGSNMGVATTIFHGARFVAIGCALILAVGLLVRAIRVQKSK
jgi:hypothetical protein